MLQILQQMELETRTKSLEQILGVMQPPKGQVVGTGSMSLYFWHPYSIADILPSPPGLASVPTTLQHLCEEVGLAGEPWETMGVEWQALGSLWLHTDTALIRSAWTNLSFTEIYQLSIPNMWKQWMFAKAMKTDATHPSEAFGNVFTEYLHTLLASTQTWISHLATLRPCQPYLTHGHKYRASKSWPADVQCVLASHLLSGTTMPAYNS